MLGTSPNVLSEMAGCSAFLCYLIPFLVTTNNIGCFQEEDLYRKRFAKETPDVVLSFEQITKLKVQKKEIAMQQKALKRAADVL